MAWVPELVVRYDSRFVENSMFGGGRTGPVTSLCDAHIRVQCGCSRCISFGALRASTSLCTALVNSVIARHCGGAPLCHILEEQFAQFRSLIEPHVHNFKG